MEGSNESEVKEPMVAELEERSVEKLTIDIVWANIFGLIMLIPTIAIFGIPYYLIWGNPLVDFKQLFSNYSFGFIGSFAVAVYLILIAGIILHELIHGIVWSRYAKQGFKSIKFGVLWSLLTPYCHCKEPLKVKHYIYGAIMPALILGLLPTILSIAIGNIALFLFGVFFIMAAAGDILTINLLRKEDMDSLVQDHPSEAGCYIFRKK